MYSVTAQIQWLFYFQKASLKYLQFVQKHLKVSRTLHCKFNLKAHTWNNINISSWQKQEKKQKTRKKHLKLWFRREKKKTLAVGRSWNVRTPPPCRRRAPPCGGFASPLGNCVSPQNKVRKKKMTNEKQWSFKHMQKIPWMEVSGELIFAFKWSVVLFGKAATSNSFQSARFSCFNWPLRDQT